MSFFCHESWRNVLWKFSQHFNIKVRDTLTYQVTKMSHLSCNGSWLTRCVLVCITLTVVLPKGATWMALTPACFIGNKGHRVLHVVSRTASCVCAGGSRCCHVIVPPPASSVDGRRCRILREVVRTACNVYFPKDKGV